MSRLQRAPTTSRPPSPGLQRAPGHRQHKSQAPRAAGLPARRPQVAKGVGDHAPREVRLLRAHLDVVFNEGLWYVLCLFASPAHAFLLSLRRDVTYLLRARTRPLARPHIAGRLSSQRSMRSPLPCSARPSSTLSRSSSPDMVLAAQADPLFTLLA
ncbi:hypothetical protein BJY52DRAFT_726056 [Lactarius psammicola]|nr:hypothetical protein BJY52DRAFT_726056 [Lactarius psammicola]